VREGKDASVETRALSSASDSGGLSVKTCYSRQRHECHLLCLKRGFARFDSAVVWTNKEYYSTLKVIHVNGKCLKDNYYVKRIFFHCIDDVNLYSALHI
jgi:hypothetical protein